MSNYELSRFSLSVLTSQLYTYFVMCYSKKGRYVDVVYFCGCVYPLDKQPSVARQCGVLVVPFIGLPLRLHVLFVTRNKYHAPSLVCASRLQMLREAVKRRLNSHVYVQGGAASCPDVRDFVVSEAFQMECAVFLVGTLLQGF